MDLMDVIVALFRRWWGMLFQERDPCPFVDAQRADQWHLIMVLQGRYDPPGATRAPKSPPS